MNRRLLRLLPVCLFAAGLLWPLAWVVAHGWTLTGRYEESLGYRYFYSLRQVYGENDFVFLPQGQLVDIVSQILQRLLTLLGYPPDTLFPRIDVFAYASVALAHLVAVGVFAWAIAPLEALPSRIVAALFWILGYYVPTAFRDLVLQPDYHPWMLSVGLVTAGLFARWSGERPEWRLQDTLVLGAFAGLAAGVKVTLVIFPFTVGLAWLLSRRMPLRSIAMAMGAVTVAEGAGFAVLAVYYGGSLARMSSFFRDLVTWLSTNSPGSPQGQMRTYFDWLQIVLVRFGELVRPGGDFSPEPPRLLQLFVVLPVLLLGSIFLVRDRRAWPIILACAAGAAAYQGVLYLRFVPATWFEATIFAQVVLWAVTMAVPVRMAMPWRWVGAGVCGLAILLSADHLTDLVARVRANHKAGRELRRVLVEAPKPVAFLVPDNSHRLPSVDSAIFKGGHNAFEFEGQWVSQIVRRLAPGREYFVQSREYYERHPSYLTSFPTVVFTVRRWMGKGKQEEMALLEGIYVTSLAPFSCDREVSFEDRTVVVCSRSFAAYLSSALGVRVDEAPGEANQFLIRAPQGSANLSKIGKIHTDLGYAVGLALRDGTQIGFRYEPLVQGKDRR